MIGLVALYLLVTVGVTIACHLHADRDADWPKVAVFGWPVFGFLFVLLGAAYVVAAPILGGLWISRRFNQWRADRRALRV